MNWLGNLTVFFCYMFDQLSINYAVTYTSFSAELLITMPIIWPKGTYGLPMTRKGCPQAEKGYEWNEGWRFQDTADVHAAYVPEI